MQALVNKRGQITGVTLQQKPPPRYYEAWLVNQRGRPIQVQHLDTSRQRADPRAELLDPHWRHEWWTPNSTDRVPDS